MCLLQSNGGGLVWERSFGTQRSPGRMRLAIRMRGMVGTGLLVDEAARSWQTPYSPLHRRKDKKRDRWRGVFDLCRIVIIIHLNYLIILNIWE